MEFDRRTIIAFALIGLILILVNTDFYQRLVIGDQPPKKSPDPAAMMKLDSLQASRSAGESQHNLMQAEAETFPQLSDRDGTDLPQERAQEKEIRIETPLYSATFSTLGGSPKSWQFKNYEGPDGGPVSLFESGLDNLVVQLPTREDTLDTGRLNFAVDYQFSEPIALHAGEKREIVFTRNVAADQLIRKTYSFAADEYTIRLKIEFVNLQNILDGYAYALRWQTGLASTEHHPADDMSYAKAYSLANKELDEFDVEAKEYKPGGNDDWPAQWAAARNKYFTVAIIPQGQTAKGVRYYGRTSKLNDQVIHKAYQIDLAMPLNRDRDFSQEFAIYIGPLDYKIVKSLGAGLEEMMNFGWKIIQPISILVLWTFTFLHKFIPNYGIVIIVFSILVKIVLHPLTKKSYQSMKEMQEIQPLMTAIREKYAKDPQRMNQEMMKLYKEHGVNPLGGCLPMLLQMPLLYALFIVFRSTIELRHANFVWWIKDLSAPDTIFKLPVSLPLYGDSVNVLPIVMGATMLIQQAMTMKDPKQKMMVYLMPIIMTLAFNTFPSGLNLYYTLFNVFSIVQQKYITTAPEKNKAKKKKSYKQFVSDWRKHGVTALFSRKRLK
ncbi:membrane protein insertase YidC [candidate division KSB1 bacterium]|nr:membrane protein insertase YidC [candidate division KSB1 bacterium]